jgi:hypothetical protein
MDGDDTYERVSYEMDGVSGGPLRVGSLWIEPPITAVVVLDCMLCTVIHYKDETR